MKMIREKGSFVLHSRDEKERMSRQHTRDCLFLGLTPGTKIWLADT
jgi:hypothetical protein